MGAVRMGLRRAYGMGSSGLGRGGGRNLGLSLSPIQDNSYISGVGIRHKKVCIDKLFVTPVTYYILPIDIL